MMGMPKAGELDPTKEKASPEGEDEEEDEIAGFERLAGAHHNATLSRLSDYQASIREPLS